MLMAHTLLLEDSHLYSVKCLVIYMMEIKAHWKRKKREGHKISKPLQSHVGLGLSYVLYTLVLTKIQLLLIVGRTTQLSGPMHCLASLFL